MLSRYVANQGRETALVERGNVVSPGPLQLPEYATIRHYCRPALGDPHEVTHSRIGSEAQDDVNMVRENRQLEDAHPLSLGGDGSGPANIIRRSRIDAAHSLPRVPTDVGVHLISTMIGQKGSRSADAEECTLEAPKVYPIAASRHQ